MLTREIHIGNLALGGSNPVRIQSMTNTNTSDTQATVRQVIELADAGCEMVRITARNKSEAENLRNIKSELALRGYHLPLIADIHFQPEAAEIAAAIVEKVRINPGNYVDKPQSGDAKIDYTDEEYQQELEKIGLRLLPLIKICKEHGTAIRVGVNHGSLSSRITARYGDTPEGMVVSALEYIELFAAQGFHNLVLSMKSSNVKTMIYSYRLLVARMTEKGYNYPLHLGVTEAGAGADARIKSAAGIGELLMEGLGDTIRVSLTENPVNEIAVARLLCNAFGKKRNNAEDIFNHNYSYTKAATINLNGIGSAYPPVTILQEKTSRTDEKYLTDFYIDNENRTFINSVSHHSIPYFYFHGLFGNHLMENNNSAILFDISPCTDLLAARRIISTIRSVNMQQPIILYKNYQSMTVAHLQILAAAEFSYFLVDGMINGICIDAPEHSDYLPEIMFSILQAMGLRRTKAEFIACPTCGRTGYNVESVLHKITEKLSHLKHLKIGVMGCIVNGPGEMADADYGYVGSGNNKVNLYKGKTAVMKNIDEAVALDELIKLIKENGDWEEVGSV